MSIDQIKHWYGDLQYLQSSHRQEGQSESSLMVLSGFPHIRWVLCAELLFTVNTSNLQSSTLHNCFSTETNGFVQKSLIGTEHMNMKFSFTNAKSLVGIAHNDQFNKQILCKISDIRSFHALLPEILSFLMPGLWLRNLLWLYLSLMQWGVCQVFILICFVMRTQACYWIGLDLFFFKVSVS